MQQQRSGANRPDLRTHQTGTRSRTTRRSGHEGSSDGPRTSIPAAPGRATTTDDERDDAGRQTRARAELSAASLRPTDTHSIDVTDTEKDDSTSGIRVRHSYPYELFGSRGPVSTSVTGKGRARSISERFHLLSKNSSEDVHRRQTMIRHRAKLVIDTLATRRNDAVRDRLQDIIVETQQRHTPNRSPEEIKEVYQDFLNNVSHPDSQSHMIVCRVSPETQRRPVPLTQAELYRPGLDLSTLVGVGILIQSGPHYDSILMSSFPAGRLGALSAHKNSLPALALISAATSTANNMDRAMRSVLAEAIEVCRGTALSEAGSRALSTLRGLLPAHHDRLLYVKSYRTVEASWLKRNGFELFASDRENRMGNPDSRGRVLRTDWVKSFTSRISNSSQTSQR